MAKSEGKPPTPGASWGGARPVQRHDPSPADALAAMGGTGITQTRTGHQTAMTVQVPRNIGIVEREILTEASLMGEDFIYTWEVNDKESPTGKSRIEGLSIEGALIMARNWGNCAIPTDKVDETASHFEFKATFVDVEKGFEIERGFRQRKSQRAGSGMAADRAEDGNYQIGWSKAQRNAIKAAMPAWLTDKAIETAKAAALKKYEDVAKWVPYIVKRAAALGVTEAELETKAEAKLADWLPSDVAYMASVFTAIAKKESSVTIEFRPTPKDAPSEPAAAKVEDAPSDTPFIPGETPEPAPKPAAAPETTAPPATAPAAAKSEPADPHPPKEPQPHVPKEPPAPDFEPPKAK